MARLPYFFRARQFRFEWDRHNLPKLAQEGARRVPGRRPVYREEAEEVFYNPHLVQGPGGSGTRSDTPSWG